ncbi:hypothetical protein Clacol_001831 [Clathrus columnatus]|uniref:Uncharacterized protein n=1 Tax=Clathrus columnatus TaxID=1419009 RepID=A0AAV5A201_9AGAM|nr:hypothetical protein Clacol_001831 [Clathrus columnatus]
MASFTLATWSAVYRPNVGTDSLAWHPRYIPLLIIFPLGASAVLIALVLKLDAVKPVSSDDMHCDITNPLWIRLFGYGGASPLFSVPFWFLSFVTAKKLFQLTKPRRLVTDTTNTSEFTPSTLRSETGGSPKVSPPFFRRTMSGVREKIRTRLLSFPTCKRRKGTLHDRISVQVHTIQVTEDIDIAIGMKDLSPRGDFKLTKSQDISHIPLTGQGLENSDVSEDKLNCSLSSISAPEFASNPSLLSKNSEGMLSTATSVENPTLETKTLPSSSLNSSAESAIVMTSVSSNPDCSGLESGRSKETGNAPSTVPPLSPQRRALRNLSSYDMLIQQPLVAACLAPSPPQSPSHSITAEIGKTLLEHLIEKSPSRPPNLTLTSRNGNLQVDSPAGPGVNQRTLSEGVGDHVTVGLSATSLSFQRHYEGTHDFVIKASSVLPGMDDLPMRSFKVFDGSNECDHEILFNSPITTSVILESKIRANRSVTLTGNGNTRGEPQGKSGKRGLLGSAIWRLLLASLSTIIDVSRGQITPFGTQHVALLIAAWGPFLLYALSKVPARIGDGRWRSD